MSMIDTNRAILISKEYRYVTRSDAAIRDKFPGATEIVIDTNLNEAGANAFADALFAAASTTKLSAFTFTIEGLLYPEDFTVAPPRFTLSFPSFPSSVGNTYTVTSSTPDFGNNRTSLTVRA